eukprot:COSAG01_NODE_3371_length_6179_cov_1.762336_5_plen_399_part_00
MAHGLACIHGLVLLSDPTNAQSSNQLLRSALELERVGCHVPLPPGLVNKGRGGGHRRTQLGMGKLWKHMNKCDPRTMQARATEVDQACCKENGGGADCRNGVPATCDWKCAVYFVPFWEDCGATLRKMGQNLDPLNRKCLPSSTTALQRAVKLTQCANPTKSCHHQDGAVKCVDKTFGGGAGTGALADCTHWTSQGGGWTPGAEDCSSSATQGNLLSNGNFEHPALSGLTSPQSCRHRDRTGCPYKYVFPLIKMAGGGNDYCVSGCTISGWRTGERDVSQRPSSGYSFIGVALAANGNRPWGGLNSHVGQQYLVLTGAGAYIEQTVTGLSRGSVYEIRLRVANRPGYGDDESLVIKIDNHIVGESAHPPDKFAEFGVAFTARSPSVVLRLENDSPNGK